MYEPDTRSARRLRAMYSTGRANPTAKRLARLWSRVFALGIAPRRWVSLEVKGRRTGQVRSFPLGMARVDGNWYLVSMLGESQWVKNVRAAGGHAVIRRGTARNVILSEVPASARPRILKCYVEQVPGGRPHIPVGPREPVDAFKPIARRFPVFLVLDDD